MIRYPLILWFCVPVICGLGSSWAGLPVKILREDTEWLDVSLPGLHKTGQKRVLLIGDSITAGYFWSVADQIKDKAIVAKLATSKSVGDPGLLQEISLVLSQCDFDVIHFNNGLHGRDYTENDYRQHFPELVATLRKGAPHAQLIWATTTPTREGEKFESVTEFTQRVRERNRIAAEILQREGIPVNDLYSLVAEHPDYFSDGVHFNPEGVKVLTAQVAERITTLLGKSIQFTR